MPLTHCEDARQRGRTLQGQRVNIVDVSMFKYVTVYVDGAFMLMVHVCSKYHLS